MSLLKYPILFALYCEILVFCNSELTKHVKKEIYIEPKNVEKSEHFEQLTKPTLNILQNDKSQINEQTVHKNYNENDEFHYKNKGNYKTLGSDLTKKRKDLIDNSLKQKIKESFLSKQILSFKPEKENYSPDNKSKESSKHDDPNSILLSLYKSTCQRIKDYSSSQCKNMQKINSDSLIISEIKENKQTTDLNSEDRIFEKDNIDKYLYSKKVLPDCSKKHKRIPILVVSTLDGQISGLNYKTGEVLWSHETNLDGDPLLSSSMSKLEVASRGEWVRLIPSLDGGIYRFDGDNIEVLPITADTLLHSSFKFNEDTIFTGGKFNEILGLEPQTGEVKYICNSRGCPQQQTTGANDQILVVKRVSQNVRAIDPKTGTERWNFNVGRHELNVANTGCESSFEDKHEKSSLPLLRAILPEGLITAIDNHSQILWQQKLPSPIVSAWSLINGQLDQIDLFSGSTIPPLIQDKSEAETDAGKQLAPSNSNRELQPSLYMGVHQQQLYIQRNKEATNSALQHFVPPRNGEKTKDNTGKMHWMPYLKVPIYQALAGYQEVKDRPLYLDYNQNAEVTTDLVLGNLDISNDFGYFLFGETEEEEILGDSEYWNTTKDEHFIEEEATLGEQMLYLCFEVSNNIWWKLAAGLGMYSVFHVLFVRYLINRISREMRLGYGEIVGALTVNILHNIFAENPQVLAIIRRMGLNLKKLPPPPHTDDMLHMVESPQRQDSNFSSRYGSDFEPVSCLGKGGFGVVFQVKNKLDENDYAIKRIVLPSKESSAERVKREVRALAKLNHGNIVRYYNSWLETPPIGWEEEADSWWRNSDAVSHSLITSPAVDESEHPMKESQNPAFSNVVSNSTNSLSGIVDRLNPHLRQPTQQMNVTDDWGKSVEELDTDSSDDDNNEDHNEDLFGDKDSHLGSIAKDDDSFEVCFEDSAEGQKVNCEEKDQKSVQHAEVSHITENALLIQNDFSRLTCKTRRFFEEVSSSSEYIFFGERGKKEARTKSSSFSLSSPPSEVFLQKRRRVKSQSFCQDSRKRPSTLNIDGNSEQKTERSKHLEKPGKNFPSTPNPRTYLYIQMELCQKQSLKEWLFNNSKRDTNQLYSMFNDIVNAVEYVHDRSLMHRDLKPSNIFFSLDGEIKIGDFGLVTTIDDDDEAKTPVVDGGKSGKLPFESQFQQRTLNAGTHLYMSPEQMNGHSYNYKVDIFSLGLIFFEMLVPFSTEMERRHVMLKAREKIFPLDFTDNHSDVANLLQLTLHRDPTERPTTRGIRARPPLVSLQKDLESISIDEHFHLTRVKSHTRSFSGSYSSSFSTSPSIT